MCRGRAVPVLLLAGLLLAATACADPIYSLRANYAARQGNDFYKAGDFKKAIEWYRYATYLNPDLDIAYYHAALANMALYKPGSRHPKDIRYSGEAIKNLKWYIESEPQNVQDAKGYLLTVFLQGERYDDAIEFFEGDLQAMGGDDPVRATQMMQTLGMIYAKKGDFENSLEWYKKRAENLAVRRPENPGEEEVKEESEALYTIGVLCWDKVYNGGLTIDLDRRRDLIEMGLDYLQQATTLREYYFEAVSYINLLYREKAKLARDLGNNEEYVKWTQMAVDNQKLALKMMKENAAKKQQ